MHVIYTQNPIEIQVTLDQADIYELEQMVRVQWYQNVMAGSVTVDPAPLDIAEDTKFYIDSLKQIHYGDCTGEPNTCLRCCTEHLLGMSTVVWWSPEIHREIEAAFATADSCDDAISYLMRQPDDQAYLKRVTACLLDYKVRHLEVVKAKTRVA